MYCQRFVSYLTVSAITGGLLGAIHGRAVSLTQEPSERTHTMFLHMSTGLFLGPWAPLALPYWLWNQPDVRCPSNPRAFQQS